MGDHADIDHSGLTGVPDLSAHTSDASDAHDASAISVLDTATNFTGTDVEAVLAELQDNIDAVSAGGDLDDLGDVDTSGVSDGDVLTFDSGSGDWIAAAPGGSAGSLYPLDDITLHGTYGDAFPEGPLDGKWSAVTGSVNQYSALPTGVPIDGELGSGRGIKQAFTSADEAQLIVAYCAPNQLGANSLVGPWFADGSGNGLGMAFSPAGTYLGYVTVASYVYSANASTHSVVRPSMDSGVPVWFSLHKRSAVYQLSYSLDGYNWSRPVDRTPSAFTPTQIGFSTLFGSSGKSWLRRFNITGYGSLGTDLVRTPTSGTPTYSASSSFGGFPASSAADNNAGTSWAANTGTTDAPLYWKVDWSVGQSFNRVRLFVRANEFGGGYLDLYDGATHTYVQFQRPGDGNTTVYIDFPTVTGITSMTVIGTNQPHNNGGFVAVEAYLLT